jgi:hypothetical protein
MFSLLGADFGLHGSGKVLNMITFHFQRGTNITVTDPDPSIFVIDLQDASKKLFFNTIFSAYDFLKLHLHHFSKKNSKRVTK